MTKEEFRAVVEELMEHMKILLPILFDLINP